MNELFVFNTHLTLLRKEINLLAWPLPETKVFSVTCCICPWKKHTTLPLLLGVQYRKTEHVCMKRYDYIRQKGKFIV